MVDVSGIGRPIGRQNQSAGGGPKNVVAHCCNSEFAGMIAKALNDMTKEAR